jgi:hypothetical protein
MIEIVAVGALLVLALVAAVQAGMVLVLVKRLVDKPVEGLITPPPSFVEEMKGLLPGVGPAKPMPLPNEVVDYCDKWMDDFAKQDCKGRAWGHYLETQDWDVVVTNLMREDGELV